MGKIQTDLGQRENQPEKAKNVRNGIRGEKGKQIEKNNQKRQNGQKRQNR